MNWYLQTGKDSDVVLNNKISYSRNLRNFKFGTENLKEIQEIENHIKSKIPSLGYDLKLLKIKDMDKLTRKSLIEKGLIDEDVAKNENASILVNDEENNTKNLDFNKRIDYYKKKSKFAIKDVSEIEKIIKLSTCSYLNNHSTPTNQRYFIIAKLEKI